MCKWKTHWKRSERPAVLSRANESYPFIFDTICPALLIKGNLSSEGFDEMVLEYMTRNIFVAFLRKTGKMLVEASSKPSFVLTFSQCMLYLTWLSLRFSFCPSTSCPQTGNTFGVKHCIRPGGDFKNVWDRAQVLRDAILYLKRTDKSTMQAECWASDTDKRLDGYPQEEEVPFCRKHSLEEIWVGLDSRGCILRKRGHC